MSRLLSRLGQLEQAPAPEALAPEAPCLVIEEDLEAPLPLTQALLAGQGPDRPLPPLLAALLRRLPEAGPRGALLFDVEATGLSRGAGTMVFLLGMVRLREGRRPLLRQVFLRTPGLERELLEAFLAELALGPLLLSFNGKSYDLAVLRNRLVVNGLLPAPEAEPRTLPHLDLLHTARALWRGALPDHRLATLETRLLGLGRPPDELAGALMPAAWFAWLNNQDQGRLEAMLAHNRQDLVSCLALTELILEGFLGGACTQPLENRVRLLAAARLWGPAGGLGLTGGARAAAWPAKGDPKGLEELTGKALRAWLRAGRG